MRQLGIILDTHATLQQSVVQALELFVCNILMNVYILVCLCANYENVENSDKYNTLQNE